ncbi:MAG: GntR family transcriptional regulator [Cellulomonadaceae bacterium]|nr:GntR family transcriptional regulator [Cellulomonadaceae bacterium]
MTHTVVDVIYMEATPEQVWHALTDAELTGAYWGHRNESDWAVGSRWRHVRTDGSGVADVVGEVLVSDPPRRLTSTWDDPGDQERTTTVTFDVEAYGPIIRLTVTHIGLRDEAERDEAVHGWAAVLSNLKTLLETGHALPRAPWEMPAGS